jgi:hypothetical protein
LSSAVDHPFNAFRLARAVAHWVGYESACGRENLLSEGSMLLPVGQYLQSHTRTYVDPEHPYPALPRRRIDIALLDNKESKLVRHAFEMKFIRESGRDYSQELFDDIVRLETLEDVSDSNLTGRWLLIAGVWDDLKVKLFDYATARRGHPSVKPFDKVLPQVVFGGDVSNQYTVDLAASTGAVKAYWKESQDDLKLPRIPKQLHIDLRTKAPKTHSNQSYVCLIWRIRRVSPRETFSLVPSTGRDATRGNSSRRRK